MGWFVKTKKPVFDPKKIIFMDFNIPQENETRFIYLLPKNSHEALVEYTLFSKNLLRTEEYENGIKSYLKSKGIVDFIIEEKEQGRSGRRRRFDGKEEGEEQKVFKEQKERGRRGVGEQTK